MSESNQSEITDPTDPAGAGAADVDDSVDADRVNERAHLLPEEIAAGSDDPQQQAEIILQESAERTLDVEGTQESSTQVP
jgi:hypothetical protein